MTRREFLTAVLATGAGVVWPRPAMAAKAAVNVQFKSYKGFGLPWGRNLTTGKWLEKTWLTSEFHLPSLAACLDSVASMGVKTLSVWLYLPTMLTNWPEITSPAFTPRWNATFKAQWEAFLGLVLARDMELIVTIYNLGPNTSDPALVYNQYPLSQPMANNLVNAARSWISGYHRRTHYGRAVAAWVGLKEGATPLFGAWQGQLYQALRGIPHCQPIGLDVWTSKQYNWTAPILQMNAAVGRCDFVGLHHYQDAPVTLPDLTSWGLPVALTELGADWTADPLWSHLQDPAYMVPAVADIYTKGRAQGFLCAMAWAWVFKMGSTWTPGPPPAFTLGPMAEWVKSYQP